MNLSLLQNGGPLMWVLLILSFVALVFFLERTLFLHRGQIRTNTFLEGIKNLVRKRRIVEALTVCEETPGPAASIVKAALLVHDQGETRMRGAIQSMALVEIPLLERRIGTIAAIAKIAPLIGLLGTVIALLEGFFAMQKDGPYADASVFSGYIAQALLVTAAGLALAIMAHMACHFLYGRVRALVNDMEWVGNEIMQFLLYGEPDRAEYAEPAEPAPKAD